MGLARVMAQAPAISMTGSAAPPLSVRGRSTLTWLGAKPSSSAALKAAATNGSRIISEICRRLTVVRNSDAVVRGVIITRLAWAIGFASFVVRVRAGAEE
jgi:hypothetical protein